MKKINAIGYIRVSTFLQAAEGISLDAQKEKIKQWADLNDAILIKIYTDNGISGTKDNRPGFQAAFEAAIKYEAAFVVYSLSRFCRTTKDTIRYSDQLRKAGANLVSISEQIDTTTAAGKMVFRLMAVLNEFEVDQISERTKAALNYRKSQGKKLGGDVPYGYRADSGGVLSKNPEEQKIIKEIMNKLGSGDNYSQIARYLNGKEYPTKKGSKWYPQTVKNVIGYQLSLKNSG